MFDVSSSITTYSTPDLIAIIVLGLIGGVFGALFNYLVDRILRTYSIINEKGDPFKILLTITISILTSCCSYGLPCLANCAPCPADLQEQCPTIGRLGNFKTFQCSPRGLPLLEFLHDPTSCRNTFLDYTIVSTPTNSPMLHHCSCSFPCLSYFVLIIILSVVDYPVVYFLLLFCYMFVKREVNCQTHFQSLFLYKCL